MLRSSRRRIAFWLVLLLFALSAGWAAQQGWRWPSLALFDWASEPQEQDAGPEVVAEQSATEEPEPEERTADAANSEPAYGPPATPPADAGTDAPAATDPPAPPPEQALAEEGADPDQETAPQPTASAMEAEPTSPSGEADVAAIEPAETDSAAPQTDPAAAVSEPAGEAPEQDQEQTSDLAAVGEATAAGAAPSGPPAEADTETGPGPSFDLVRVGRDGRAVIAGRAAPGAEVEVRAGGQVIDRVRASRRGEWVAIPAMPLAAGDQELSAVTTRAGAAPVESDQVVVVAVPGPAAPAPAATAAASAPAQPVAVLLPREGRGTGRILQAPGRLSAEGTLALMTVSYDAGGQVLLSGEAPPGVPVQIYVDNRPAAIVVGDAKGDWAAGLDEALAPGTYTLRLDQLDADGKPVARIETPFTRVSEPPVEGNLQVDYVVVQPGNSLWRIARRLSGKGLDYVHIYGANDAQIRNPDLIYPGQVFEIPREFGSAG
jgi:nucleoid-associated protein YgaU